jgi:hypothetical protein
MSDLSSRGPSHEVRLTGSDPADLTSVGAALTPLLPAFV